MDDIDRINDIVDKALSKHYTDSRVDVSFLDKIIKYIRDLIEKILKFIFELLGELLEKLASLFNIKGGIDLSGSKRVISIVVVVIAIVIIVALSLFIVSLIIKYIRTKKANASGDAFSEELVSMLDDPDRPMTLVMEYLEKGEYRQAYRYLFIGLLIELNKKEYIFIQISKTNRQYKTEVESRDSVIFEDVKPFFEDFDRFWYGGKKVTEEKVRAYITAFEKLRMML